MLALLLFLWWSVLSLVLQAEAFFDTHTINLIVILSGLISPVLLFSPLSSLPQPSSTHPAGRQVISPCCFPAFILFVQSSSSRLSTPTSHRITSSPAIMAQPRLNPKEPPTNVLQRRTGPPGTRTSPASSKHRTYGNWLPEKKSLPLLPPGTPAKKTMLGLLKKSSTGLPGVKRKKVIRAEIAEAAEHVGERVVVS